MKNSNDTIGNRTRDLQVCIAVPQSTACSKTGLVKSKLNSTAAHEGPDREYTYSPSLTLNLTLDGDG